MTVVSQEQHDLLNEKAKGIVSDVAEAVAEMHPHEGEPDLGYNLWVETLDDTLYGVIDMGDLYHGAFEWNGERWEMSPADSHELEERIWRLRTAY